MLITAITFDYWGTLYHAASGRLGRMERLAEVLGEHGYHLDSAVLESADRAAWLEWDRIWREEYRTLSAADWLHLMFGHLGVTLPAQAVHNLAEDFDTMILRADPPPRLIDGVEGAIRRLAQHYRLAIIWDTGLSSGRTLRRFLDRDEMTGCFACLSFSDETGVSKPHPDAFRRTLNCLAAQPAQAVHVGDLTRTDIFGAKAVGMRAVRFAGSNDDPDRSTQPDAVISSYTDLEPLLQAWNKA